MSSLTSVCMGDCKHTAASAVTWRWTANCAQVRNNSLLQTWNQIYPSTSDHASKKWQKTTSDAQAQARAKANQAAKAGT